jgi:hypothetical protein
MQSFSPYVVYVHSILRYFILFFALIVVIQSLTGLMGKKKFVKTNRIMALFLLICCDIQLLLGLILYYSKVLSTGILSSGTVMTDPANRFWAVEHSAGMLIAIILVHIGYTFTKRNMDDDRKFKRLFWCTFIALGIFVAMIPWEGKQVVGRPNMPALHVAS